VTELEMWECMKLMVGKVDAYKAEHAAEYNCRPRWCEYADVNGQRVWAYAVFVQVEQLCEQVSKGVR
jgi:hypothetical protein